VCGSHLPRPIRRAELNLPASPAQTDIGRSGLRDDSTAGYLVVLTISWVGFVIVRHTYARETAVTYDGALSDALVQIWPHRAVHVAWPPQHMMDQDLVELVAVPEQGLTLDIRPSEQRRKP
jgi:hypothetical protein